MSVRALIRRGHDLKLLTPAQYRTANIHLVKAGQAKVEKYDDDGSLPVEQPELLSSALRALDDAVHGGPRAVGDEIGLSASMIELVTGIGLPDRDPALDDSQVVRLRIGSASGRERGCRNG